MNWKLLAEAYIPPQFLSQEFRDSVFENPILVSMDSFKVKLKQMLSIASFA